jgi:hypothetical protein
MEPSIPIIGKFKIVSCVMQTTCITLMCHHNKSTETKIALFQKEAWRE